MSTESWELHTLGVRREPQGARERDRKFSIIVRIGGFALSDRLLWLILRRLWPQWRDALRLVQPATVDRWHRDRFGRRWWRRSRRAGRPRSDSQIRDLIGRLADENRLWGAPRIHGELLKLGIVVSERTVSRYPRGRPKTPSQTWQTFFANHLGQVAVISELSPYASGEDVVDAFARNSTPSSDGLYASRQCSLVDWPAPIRSTFLCCHFTQDHVRHCTGMRSTGRPHRGMDACGRLTEAR